MSSVTVPTSRLAQLAQGIPRPFWALLVGTFITRAGSFVMPLLFVYLTQRRGLELPLAGGIVALYGFGALLGSVLGGALADRYGRRFTMLTSYLVSATFLLLLGVSEALPTIALSTFAFALAADLGRPATLALMADIIPSEHRLKAFSMIYWVINLGVSFAAVIGGYMATRNFAALFIGDAASTLVLALIIWRFVPETRPEPVRHAAKAGSLLTPFFDRRFAPFLVLNLLVATVFFLHLSVQPDDMNHKGLSTEDYGLSIATNGVLIVLLQPFITRLQSGWRHAHALALAALLTGVGFGLNAWAHSLPAYVGAVAVWTLGEILFAPVNSTVVAQLSPENLRGRYQGSFTLTWGLASMLAPVLGASLIPLIGHRGVWLGAVVVGALAAVGHLTISARVLPKDAKGE